MLHPLIWPQSEKRTVLFRSRTSRHLAVVTASGARKNKQRHSSVPLLSFDTEEVEELNIATRADTMMTALSPPSSYSITNGRVWYQRLFPHQTTLRPPFINCLLIAVSCSSLCLKAPRRRRQIQKKRKNNPPFPRK